MLAAACLVSVWWSPRAVPATAPALESVRGASGSLGIHARASGSAAVPAATAAAEEFRDTFYAFLIGIAENDSLGTWTRQDLLDYCARQGRQSNLPLDRILTLERRAIDQVGVERLAGRTPRRIWRVTLDARLDYPMPHRVLGTSLGSLDVARELVFSEWWLGDCRVFAPQDGVVTGVIVQDLTAFRLEAGWIVMDVSGLVDRLLGRKLDDCWVQGFAICRNRGRLHGLAVSCNRDLQPVCGEIDFATNEIIPEGRPLARGVAVYVRPWLRPQENNSRLWQFVD
jgi:hypothetical protein